MHRIYKLIVPRFNWESTVKYAAGMTGFGVLPQNHVRGGEDGGSGCSPLTPQPLSKRMYGVGVESVRLFAAVRHDLREEPAIARRVEQRTMPADRSLLSD